MTLQTSHSSTYKSTGVLLSNIGSPQAPTTQAVRDYLSEFLADQRIIDWPRWLWLPILKGIVLRVRPKRSARLYRNIWDDGSPLLNIAQEQTRLLADRLAVQGFSDLRIGLGMRYGKPSIAETLRSFREAGINRILIVPLFPQYSLTTSASTMDAVEREISTWDIAPDVHSVHDYHDDPGYIEALCNSILQARTAKGMPEKLLFSFHGEPKRYARNLEVPYEEKCRRTASLVAQHLDYPKNSWHVAFQSRFGPEQWLEPYTDETLKNWGTEKMASTHILCPGFSADCLETLDEIDREAKNIYEEAGGRGFYYIPALNTRPDHINALAGIITRHLPDSDPRKTSVPQSSPQAKIEVA